MSPLTQEQLNELGRLLDERERELKSDVHEHVASLRDNSPPGVAAPAGDMADQAEAGLLRSHDNVAVVRDVRELRDIEAARERIAGGRAGICIDCDEQIPFARLQLQPAAARCVDCQRRHESTQAADTPAGLVKALRTG